MEIYIQKWDIFKAVNNNKKKSGFLKLLEFKKVVQIIVYSHIKIIFKW